MMTFQKISRLYNLPENEDFGFPEAEMIALEKRLGIHLPAALKNYYLALGKNEQINDAHNRLLKPEKEMGFSEDRYLMFYEENQAVVSWGIKAADLQLNNPPVWGNTGTDTDPEWYLETHSTEDFFLLMSVYNGTFGGLQYNANYFGPVDPAVVQVIKNNWTIVPEISFKKQQVFTNDFYEVISLSFDDDDQCTAVFTGTSHQERFDNILDSLNVDWSYTSYEDEDEDFEA